MLIKKGLQSCHIRRKTMLKINQGTVGVLLSVGIDGSTHSLSKRPYEYGR